MICGIAILMSDRSDGGGKNENVCAWLLCLSGGASTAEVTPLSGSGVLSLLAKVSMLLLLAWSLAHCCLLFCLASRSNSPCVFVGVDFSFVAFFDSNQYSFKNVLLVLHLYWA